jgi:hypothetical protein
MMHQCELPWLHGRPGNALLLRAEHSHAWVPKDNALAKPSL